VINSGSALRHLTVNTGIGQSTTFTGTLNGSHRPDQDGQRHPDPEPGLRIKTVHLWRAPTAAGPPSDVGPRHQLPTPWRRSAPASSRCATRSPSAPARSASRAAPSTLAAIAGTGYAGGELTDWTSNSVQFGPGSGYDITVDQPQQFRQWQHLCEHDLGPVPPATAPVAWSLVNNVTLNAPALTLDRQSAHQRRQIAGTLAVSGAGATRWC
jgi:hypothetical protein